MVLRAPPPAIEEQPAARRKKHDKKKHGSVESGISFRLCVSWRQIWNREPLTEIVPEVTKFSK